MTHTSAREKEMRIYLRAEPDEESREILLRHRSCLAEQLKKLGVTPLLAPRGDFHRTDLFIGSIRDWQKAFKTIGVEINLSLEDLLTFVDLPKNERSNAPSIPIGYDIFFARQGHFAGVMRLQTSELQAKLIKNAEEKISLWEQQGRIPEGQAKRFIGSTQYPLMRDKESSKPHITLVRGNIKNENIRKLTMKVVSEMGLASRDELKFSRIDARAVRSTKIIAVFA